MGDRVIQQELAVVEGLRGEVLMREDVAAAMDDFLD